MIYKRFFITAVIVFSCSIQILASDTIVVVKGYVYDESDGTHVANVNIMEMRSKTGTFTDTNGFFSFSLPDKNLQLRIMHIAYKEKIIEIKEIGTDALLHILLVKSPVEIAMVRYKMP